VWNHRRIVPRAWVLESTRPHIAINPQTTGLSPDEFGNYYGEGRDGLAWHLGELRANGRSYATYAAGGNGGQVLLVVPDLQLVVVFTGANYGQGGVWSRWGQQIVGDKIIPAIVKS
jgi:CubicO group peptidase (beta-lactamase class C family)